MSHTLVKSVLRKLGIYRVVRRVYYSTLPSARRQRAQEVGFFQPMVAPGDLCFDVGANVGQTIEVLTALGARIVSVEPNPLCARLLREQYAGRGDLTLVESALGPALGMARLHFDGTESTASLRADWPYAAPTQAADVRVRTLDDLIAEFGVPRLCKIDVEGFELEVLRGLSRPLPLVVFEFHRTELERAVGCLARLREIAPDAEGRAVEVDYDRWVTPTWLDCDELARTLADFPYEHGNVVVRTPKGSGPSDDSLLD